MKTELGSEDVVVQLAGPQIFVNLQSYQNANAQPMGAATVLAAPAATVVGTTGDAEGAARGAGGGGGGGGAGAAAECGRRLLLAARAGDTATVRHLMAKGVPFTTDWLGTSPLHLAAANNHSETVSVLLRAGVSRDARTKVERTALHVAAHAGHAGAARALLEHGAAVDARDMLRMTPLHWSVERGHVAVARLLLAHGADPRLESKFRKSPLSLAAARAAQGRPELLALLTDCMAQREAKRSVDALQTVRMDESPAAAPETEPARIQKIQDTPTKAKTIPQQQNTPPTESKTELPTSPANSGGMAALLRQHGITLLPRDTGSTVLSALQSGRTVVLSDAGKLMLKESNKSAASVPPSAPPPTGAGGGGVLLTATPVRAPPPGVTVISLPAGTQAKLRHRPAAPPAPAPPAPAPPAPAPPAPAPPANTATDEQKTDVQQVKLVQLAGGAGGGAARPAVRIIMNRNNYRKLIATATRASNAQVVDPLEESDADGSAESVVVVPEQFVRSASPQYLRSQLLCAHAAIQHLARELAAARAQLARRAPH